jgi:hypothetical protein
MKRFFTQFKSLRLAAFTGIVATATFSQAQAQIVNGGFEQWTSLLTMQDPTGWNSSNLLALFSGDSASVTKSRDAHWGQYAAKLTPRYSSLGDDTLPAILIGQFPITSRPAGLRFMYKFKPGTGDSAIVSAELYKGSTDSSENLVGELTWIYGGTNNTYTPGQANFEYYDSRTPDTLVVTIIVGQEEGSRESSTFLIDDITTTAFPASVRKADPVTINVYPNPGNGVFMLEGMAPGKALAKVYDLNGRLVRNAEVNNSRIDLNGMQAGCYLLQVETEGELFSGRLIISE